MPTDQVLLMTDLVDSTQIGERLGDAAAAALWATHDREMRRLLRAWHGREIDKSDGFLALFGSVDEALACALALHEASARMVPPLHMRAGLHRGSVTLRANPAEDVAAGAKPLEVDGLAKAVVARIMVLARGGQTLLSEAAHAALGARSDWRVVGHGHWRLKGVDEPVALYEAAAPDGACAAPADGAKAWRVVQRDGRWLPQAEIPNSLPTERDGFVGRQAAIDALVRRFDEGARLVNIVGMAGIGKTRLALRFAREWMGGFPGGAWFCDLAAARELDGVLHAVARGLDVPLGKADPVQQLGAALASRGDCLLILDNFEQVARHAETLLGPWLDRAPQARLLVTSREVLGLRGEVVQALAPMDVADAAQLFARRARDGDDGYRPDAADQAAIPTLLDLLDHLPLAIELAAARVRLMPPRTMLARMNERFRLLAAPGRRQDRQATLHAALDWSWDLLSPVERSALAQLSVMEGSFTLASAEQVLDFADVDDAPWPGDVVQSLADKSWVHRLSGERHRLLRSVSDYAAERLAEWPAPRRNRVEQRHWQHFVRFDEVRATADRCADLDNLIAACRRAAAQEPAQAVQALAGVWAALKLIGPTRAVLPLAEALQAAPLTPPDEALLRWVSGAAQLHLGDTAAALLQLERGLQLTADGQAAQTAQTDQTDQTAHLAHLAHRVRLLCSMAELRSLRTEHAMASQALAEAASRVRDCGDARLTVRVLNTQGSLALQQSRHGHAIAHFEEALAAATAAADLRWQGGLHGNLGIAHYQLGHQDAALAHYRQAVALARQVGDRQFEGNSRCNLGLLLHETGDLAGALDAFEAALAIAQQIGHPRLACSVRCNLGIVHEARGAASEARGHYQEAVALAQALHDARLLGQSLGYLALLQAQAGEAATAVAAFERAAGLLEATQDRASQALLRAQMAVAACHVPGLPPQASLLAYAETALTALGLDGSSELGRMIERARQAAQGLAAAGGGISPR